MRNWLAGLIFVVASVPGARAEGVSFDWVTAYDHVTLELSAPLKEDHDRADLLKAVVVKTNLGSVSLPEKAGVTYRIAEGTKEPYLEFNEAPIARGIKPKVDLMIGGEHFVNESYVVVSVLLTGELIGADFSYNADWTAFYYINAQVNGEGVPSVPTSFYKNGHLKSVQVLRRWGTEGDPEAPRIHDCDLQKDHYRCGERILLQGKATMVEEIGFYDDGKVDWAILLDPAVLNVVGGGTYRFKSYPKQVYFDPSGLAYLPELH